MTNCPAVTTLDAALGYHARGWAVVPIPAGQKAPVVTGWQRKRLTEWRIGQEFATDCNVGLILGELSGGLVDVDLDCPEAIELAHQYLPPTAVTGREGKPGLHYWYIAKGASTKQFRDPQTGGSIVELRSTGAQTVVGPSVHPDGTRYEVLAGEPVEIESGELLACVGQLVAAVIERRYPGYVAPAEKPVAAAAERRGCNVSRLERRAVAYLAGMPPAIAGQGGHNLTLSAASNLVNGLMMDPETAYQILQREYNPRCQPEWKEKDLRRKVDEAVKNPPKKGRGWLLEEIPVEAAEEDNYSGILSQNKRKVEVAKPAKSPEPKKHQPFPSHLLEVPGYCSEFVAHCMECAPYPSQVLAFAGALAGLAFLTGRKIRDPADNRTNIYLLGLAAPGVGKDFARKLNKTIAQKVNLSECVGEQIASGEGLMDQLWMHPCMLYQTDEIDTMLQSISKSKDARYESMIAAFLNLYSSANSFVVMRSKSKKTGKEEESKNQINNPCLVLYGTAIPENYYSALNERMLTNGFFARTIVLECAGRGLGQEPKLKSPPERLLTTASYWAGFNEPSIPDPSLQQVEEVPYSPDALGLLGEYRRIADQEWIAADSKSDRVAQTVWARANEQTRKLALLYAASENHLEPVIGAEAVTWAHEFVSYQIQQMLQSVENHSAANPFDELCLKVKNRLRDAGEMPHNTLLRRMKIDSDSFFRLIKTLRDREEVERIGDDDSKLKDVSYRLIPGKN